MSSSFEKINYNLRPNKCIERKMMCEALNKLVLLEHLYNYRYIGFGSPYFADFALFHKHLGITDLVSIEKEEAKRLRFDFNIPYAGIKMYYGLSETILPNLELETKKNILWLDYDDPLMKFMFSDINTYFFKTRAGSFFILSVNVQEDFIEASISDNISLKDYRLKKLAERISKEKLPSEFADTNMNTKNLTYATYEMITRQIAATLVNINGENDNKVYYEQLFNFLYKDNATILTIGGIIFDDTQKAQVQQMDFDSLPFIRRGIESFEIKAPNLTFREIKALDKLLPDKMELTTNGDKLRDKKFKQVPLILTDIINYAKIYRYYPHFSETNI